MILKSLFNIRNAVAVAVHRLSKQMTFRQNSLRGVCLIAVGLWLFQETLKPEKPRTTAKAEDQKEEEFNRIRCPLCKWQPNARSRWYCVSCDYPEYFYDGCGATWNTFTTRGRCPGCGHQWRWTSCLVCAGWSRHENWYDTAK
jgi:hypothetical protein